MHNEVAPSLFSAPDDKLRRIKDLERDSPGMTPARKFRPAMYTLIAIAMLALSGAGLSAHASDTETTCAAAISGAEAKHGMPDHLLRAISLVESGRWSQQKKRMVAWPWTVNNAGDAHFFGSKAEAVAHVRSLQARGETNIDIGCMQINLYYHPKAFTSLDQAFEPDANVGYASRYLAAIYREEGSWLTAAGHYHSETDNYSNRYRSKLLTVWTALRRSGAFHGWDELDQTELREARRGS